MNSSKDYTVDELVDNWAVHYEKLTQSLTLVSNSEQDERFHDVARKLARYRGASFLKQIWYAHNLSVVQQFRDFLVSEQKITDS